MMSTNTAYPVQINLKVYDIFKLILSLPKAEQNALFEQLKMQLFKQEWAKLSEEIPQAGLSEDEIMEEVRSVRYVK